MIIIRYKDYGLRKLKARLKKSKPKKSSIIK